MLNSMGLYVWGHRTSLFNTLGAIKVFNLLLSHSTRHKKEMAYTITNVSALDKTASNHIVTSQLVISRPVDKSL